jgi:NAD+ diphosphatase
MGSLKVKTGPQPNGNVILAHAVGTAFFCSLKGTDFSEVGGVGLLTIRLPWTSSLFVECKRRGTIPSAQISFEHAVSGLHGTVRGNSLGASVSPVRLRRSFACRLVEWLPFVGTAALMETGRPNFFAGPYADRRADVREEADWPASARSDPDTLYIVARDTTHLMYLAPQPRIAFVTGESPAVRGADPQQLVLLGWFKGARCVLLELRPDQPFEAPVGASFEELRPLSPLLSAESAGLLAYARALTIWRQRQQFCGVCGYRAVAERAGHVIRCTNPATAHEFFPRIDPAIIVLVTDGERALLGRQASWPPGRYSTIAGFVEPGESLEDAVSREVLEETGVTVERPRYDSSQPWPFPSSLMIGFQAQAAANSQIRTGNELEDARWFTREEIRSVGIPHVPPSHSISYRLIFTWLESGR